MQKLVVFSLTLCLFFVFVSAFTSRNFFTGDLPTARDGDSLAYPEESHFKNIQQLTFGGDNAEAYLDQDLAEKMKQGNLKILLTQIINGTTKNKNTCLNPVVRSGVSIKDRSIFSTFDLLITKTIKGKHI